MDNWLAWLISALILGMVIYQILRDRRAFPEFVGLTSSESRLQYFRKFLLVGILKFSVFGIVGLFLLGHGDAIFRFPAPLEAATAGLGLSGDTVRLIGFCIAVVFAIALVVLTIVPIFMKLDELPNDGVFAMLPRNYKEMWFTAGLSVNAGIGEELVFRVLLPLALLQATGSLPIALGISVLIFGLAHGYQGLTGVISTSIAGLLFMTIYLMSGELWLVMLLHVLTDIRGLVVLPLIIRWFDRFDDDGRRIEPEPAPADAQSE